jgi:hypothetical protein
VRYRDCQVRVNYYVRELYGDPDEFHDAWAAPFGVLAMKAPTAIFVHPVVEKVPKGPPLRRPNASVDTHIPPPSFPPLLHAEGSGRTDSSPG